MDICIFKGFSFIPGIVNYIIIDSMEDRFTQIMSMFKIKGWRIRRNMYRRDDTIIKIVQTFSWNAKTIEEEILPELDKVLKLSQLDHYEEAQCFIKDLIRISTNR